MCVSETALCCYSLAQEDYDDGDGEDKKNEERLERTHACALRGDARLVENPFVMVSDALGVRSGYGPWKWLLWSAILVCFAAQPGL